MPNEYQQYLIERFEEEVVGESLFHSLSEHAANSNRQQQWHTLAQLETETKEHIRAALRAMGVEVAEQRSSIERGQQLAKRFTCMPWREFMTVFRPSLENFVAEFTTAENMAPEEGKQRALLRHITLHEKALLEFACREIEGRSDASLEPVVALLGAQLPDS
ncbi:hypothetical protein H3V53_26865 [Paraburkholderia bengalensis]|uniref:Ferritin-like metal-binding protein YciE n=1 Tax=Paraburkholderia bengalensis TaxID=2747562 RepID=A0ABU8IYD6_9BURK